MTSRQVRTADGASPLDSVANLGTKIAKVNPASRNREFYDRIAHEYDRSYHSNSKYTTLRTEVETAFIISNMVPNGRTLEVGPGQGRFTQRLAENSQTVVAADVSVKMLEICKTRTKAQNVVYRHADLFELEETTLGGMFDTIVVIWVIPHLEDAIVAMRKLLSLLKPNGRIIFDLWNLSSLRSRQTIRSNQKKRHELGHWIRELGGVYTRYYTYPDMLNLLASTGLTSVDERGWCVIPLMNYHGRRLLFPLYRVLDNALQAPFRKYYHSRLFCCIRS
jgi:2-polyprenyl-3-methyl-5-hydroxy-6-metoxy-1,4-benzoquinol methylase